MRFALMALISLSFLLGGAFSAQANTRAEEGCRYKLVKAADQYASCLFHVRNKRAGKSGKKHLEARLNRCHEIYSRRFRGITSRYGEESCTSVSDEELARYIDHVTLQIQAASGAGGGLPEISDFSPVFGFSSSNPKKTGPSQYLSRVFDLHDYYGQTYSDSSANPVIPNDECFGDPTCSVARKTNWGMVSATPGITRSLDKESWPQVLEWINSLHDSRQEPITVAIYIGLPSGGLTPAAWGTGSPGSTKLDEGISLALWIEYPTNHPTVSDYNGYLKSLAAFLSKNSAITDVALRVQDPAHYPEFDPSNLSKNLSDFPSGVRLSAIPYISTNGGAWCLSPGDAGSFCSTQTGCSDLGQGTTCSGSNFAERLASYRSQATPSGCSNSLEVSGAWLAKTPRFSGLTYDLEAGGCWALAKQPGQPAPDDKQAFLESLFEHVSGAIAASTPPASSALPAGIDACTCYLSSDSGVSDCFKGQYAACKSIYLPVFNYAKQECNPDSKFWDNISQGQAGRSVYGMISLPNGSTASSVDWDKVAQCVSNNSNVLSGIWVDLEKTSTANCTLDAADVAVLKSIPEVRVAADLSGTCDVQWTAQGVSVVTDFMCYDGNQKLTQCQQCPVAGSTRYMFGQGKSSGVVNPTAACKASGAPLDYYFNKQ